jgi:hypothetical protein
VVHRGFVLGCVITAQIAALMSIVCCIGLSWDLPPLWIGIYWQWRRRLRRRSAAERLLGSWVRIPPGAWILSCTVFVLSGRGLCDRPIPRPEVSYRLWCVLECDQMKSQKTLDTCCEQVGRRRKDWGRPTDSEQLHVKSLFVYSKEEVRLNIYYLCIVRSFYVWSFRKIEFINIFVSSVLCYL